MTSSAIVPSAGPARAPSRTLAELAPGQRAVVVTVAGEAGWAEHLAAAGLWAGAEVECLQRAPFGDPLLFRLHGYRLALRRDEAAAVLVAPPTEPGS